ncbi:hypothetical protein BYT27DRAFT_7066347, partial [Phlegmacium glaucopus]
SPIDVLLEVLNQSSPEYQGYRTELYKNSSSNLGRLLDTIMDDKKGAQKLNKWMLPHALDLVCSTVYDEMDALNVSSRLPGMAAITPEFIKNWDASQDRKLSPTLTRILETAAQTEKAKTGNKKKRPEMTCTVIVNQLMYQRSNRSSGFPAQFGLFLWSTGCAKQTIKALHRCGICVSYNSVLHIFTSLADECIQLAIKVGSGMHVFCYDNVNISTSIFVEQHGSAGPAKVTSGTFAVLYPVRNGNP